MMDTKLLFKKNGNIILLLIAAVFGILLMLLAPSNAQTEKNICDEQYVKEAEEKISEMISKICKGEVSVIVSADTAEEYVYAKNTSNLQEESPTANKASQSGEYAVINGQAVLTTVVKPKIRGVAVVCKNGDDPILQNKIINLLSRAYGISSTKICVAGY